MWVAMLSAFFAPAPLLALLLGLLGLGRSVRHRRIDRQTVGALALIALTLTGRWWIRLLRPPSADDPKPLTPGRTGFATGWGGVPLEWEQFGRDDAPTLLLSHGWSLTHETWYYQKKALAREFRVIVWNMRSNGLSGTPTDADYSLNAHVHDLAAVFDAVDAGRHPHGCVLVGHSLGAMLLPLFAATFPERMERVCGLAMLAGTDRPLLETMRGRIWLRPTRKIFWEPLAKIMGRWPRPWNALSRLLWQVGSVHMALMYGLHRGRESRGQDDLVAYHCGHFSMQAAAYGALACFAYDVRAQLSKIRVPVLLLTGDCDLNMPEEIQRAMATRLEQPELVILPDCGHLNLLECHQEVNAHLQEFARRCCADA